MNDPESIEGALSLEIQRRIDVFLPTRISSRRPPNRRHYLPVLLSAPEIEMS